MSGDFATSARSACQAHGFSRAKKQRSARRPSPCQCRVGSHVNRFEACSTFTRVTACLIAGPPSGPLSRRLRRFRHLHHRFDSFRLERPSCRGDWLPLEIRNLSRPTPTPIASRLPLGRLEASDESCGEQRRPRMKTLPARLMRKGQLRVRRASEIRPKTGGSGTSGGRGSHFECDTRLYQLD
jgi:hypothetical protein